jgi:hypothetical protein
MVANMASRKKRYPKRELSLMEAFEHVNNRTFHTLHAPPPGIMWNVIKEIPFAVAVMPQATRDMQLYALRNRGRLLTRHVDWKFDVERLFPGSSAWIERYRQDIINCAQSQSQKNEEGKHAIELTWSPIRTLSMRNEKTISPEVRRILRDLPNELTESYLMELAALPLECQAPPLVLNQSECTSMSDLFDIT